MQRNPRPLSLLSKSSVITLNIHGDIVFVSREVSSAGELYSVLNSSHLLSKYFLPVSTALTCGYCSVGGGICISIMLKRSDRLVRLQ